MQNKDIIIALDFSNKADTLSFLDKFKERKPFVKVGMELFYAEGADILKEIKDRGHKIFLDLKLCDIPNTVSSAMKVLTKYNIDIVNVHALGSKKMMAEALNGLIREDGTRPLIIGVTILTSIDKQMLNDELLINGEVKDAVLNLAKSVKVAGLDGVVCSPLEAKSIKEVCGDNFITVTPGIRFEDSNVGDQKRIATPKLASGLGCDFLVMGRPITRAEDPVMVYERALKDFGIS